MFNLTLQKLFIDDQKYQATSIMLFYVFFFNIIKLFFLLFYQVVTLNLFFLIH